ncbi:MAG: serine/threonine protein kinase [Deltaproteobacteria bacterium]|nr:serine/threonine protein kinase [Deltaproteobacteria bacterium]
MSMFSRGHSSTTSGSGLFDLFRPAPKPDRFGSYELEHELGHGGMGVVYQARHRLLGRRAALKVLPDELDPVAMRRFEREVRRTAFLHHPSTVTVYDYGRSEHGRFYYAMELVDGHDLSTLVERSGPLSPGRVLGILRDIAGALAEAHGQGLVHRDIKPANLMLCRESGRRSNGGDRAKVLDFGLVRETTDPNASLSGSDGLVTGTPHYLAPEAIRTPDDVDGRADLYSLGATAYFLLTGRHVFADAKGSYAVCAAHLAEPVVPPSRYASVPAALERIVLRLLAKDRMERPANAALLQDELDAIHLPMPTHAEADAFWDGVAMATLAA